MIMNKHFIFLTLLLGIMIAALSSCSTTQTFVVHGTPGTVISKNNVQMAVVDQSGQAQITLNRKDGYQHFMLAQVPGSNLKVPFALDYLNKNRNATSNLCKGIASIGLGTEVLGLICLLASGGKSSLMLTGGLIVGAGALIALPSALYIDSHKNQLHYNYDYLLQSTNNDLIR